MDETSETITVPITNAKNETVGSVTIQVDAIESVKATGRRHCIDHEGGLIYTSTDHEEISLALYRAMIAKIERGRARAVKLEVADETRIK